jgi:alkyl sulfatase BDS1-like metallo-beta-lactamase superfamily hydrolase
MRINSRILGTIAFIPLILSIGIIPVIPFSDASEYSQICIDKVWVESTKGRIACVTPSTADKLIERGWGTMLSDDILDELKEVSEVTSLELPPYPNQPPVNPDFDAHTDKFWPPTVTKVTDGAYVAVGYGLANSIMIEGDDGIIIIDAMTSYETAKEVMTEFRKITDKPVKAIIYSHSHPDHVNGAGAFAEEASDDLEIYAHSTLLDNYYHESGELATLIATRGIYYYGVLLPQEGPDRFVNAGIGPFLEAGDVTSAFLPPTITFDDRLDIEVAGLEMSLINVPSETNDETIVWIPEMGVLQGGEVLYELWPNLYSVRGSSYRDVKKWISSLDVMIDLEAEHLILSHTRPVSGAEEVRDVLTSTHDAVQYIYDQTIRGINQGYTEDELAHMIELPQHLQDHPWLQERYGERAWHVRGIVSGNVGWFEGDSTYLNTISFEERSQKTVNGFGGIEKTLQMAITAIHNGEYQWAAELATYVIETDPDNEDAKMIKAHALRVLGQQAHSSGARNWYITDALELEGKITVDPTAVTVGDPDQIAGTPIHILLEQAPTRIDPQKADGIDMVVGIVLPDVDESYTFHIRNNIAAYKVGLKDNMDVKFTVDASVLKETLAGLKTFEDSISEGKVTVEGSMDDARTFISLFDPYVQTSSFAD